MIVEFFGPPAAGKTTLAVALSRLLQESGQNVSLIMSDRPADRRKAGLAEGGLPRPLQRMARPAAALSTTTREIIRHSSEAQTVSRVLAMIPPGGVLASLRFRQYLLRLLLSWRQSARHTGVTLFDQGCAQAICSLATRAATADRESLCAAMALLPQPDLLIRVDAPAARVEAKLRARLARQGPIERLMERSVEGGLAFIPVVAEMDVICRSLNHRVILVDTSDEQARHDGLLRILDAIAAIRQVRPEAEPVAA